MSKALSPLDRTVQVVRRVERRVIKKAMAVVEQGALHATLINDDGKDDTGETPLLTVKPGVYRPMTERELRIAKDMRKSKRNAPLYIDVLTRRLEGAEKLDALLDTAAPVTLNIGTVNVVTAPEFESIDVDAKEVKE